MSSSQPVLGRTVQGVLDRPETIPAPDDLVDVSYICDEVTAICPITGNRDFYSVTIDLTSPDRILESKSMKMWLAKFANEGIFAEQLACTIQQELREVLPRVASITVTTTQKSRGGISIRSTSIGFRESYD